MAAHTQLHVLKFALPSALGLPEPQDGAAGGSPQMGAQSELSGVGVQGEGGSPETNAEGACWHRVQDSVQKGVRVPRCKQEMGREMLLKKL